MGFGASTEVASALPLLAVLLPMVGAPLVYWLLGTENRAAGAVVALLSLGPLGALAGVVGPAFSGTRVVSLIPALPDFLPHLSVDGLALAFALMAAVIWPAVTIYGLSTGYPQAGRPRFFATSMITFGATVGVFLAGDILSFFLFFELMTFSAYILLTHRRNRATLLLSSIYLYIGVAGGLALFLAFMLIWHLTGTTAMVPALDAILESGTSPYLLASMFLIGFGAKAGVIGLHIWLPSTYVRSPFPATAMFSAVMSKAGIYGMLRFLTLIMSGGGPATDVTMNLGWMFLWPGLATMILGAAMAIKAHSVKRLLAFSSMSQMGYMIVGVSMVLALGEHGSLAAAGTVLHAVNHALFKTMLFLLVGSVAVRSRSYGWKAVRGLAPGWAIVPLAVAALGVSGVPGLSGFVSKTLIHEALEQAYHLYHLPQLHWAEYAFVLGSALTAAYYIKLLGAVLWRRPLAWIEHESTNAGRAGIPDHFDPPPSLPARPRLAPAWAAPSVLAALALTSVVLGLAPAAFVGGLGVPAVAPWGFPAYDVAHLPEVHFFGGHALEAAAKALGLGTILYAAYALVLCRVFLPAWLSLERWVVTGIALSNRWLKASLRFEYLSMATYFATEEDRDVVDEPGETGGDPMDEDWDPELIRLPRPGLPGWLKALTGPGMAERITGYMDRGRGAARRDDVDETDLSANGSEGETGDYDVDLIRLPQRFHRRPAAQDQPGTGGAEGETGDYDMDLIPLPRLFHRRPTARDRSRGGGRRPRDVFDVAVQRLEGISRRVGARWQSLLKRLPLPDFASVNTRNLNFAALMLAVLSTLTLIYLVSRTRMGP